MIPSQASYKERLVKTLSMGDMGGLQGVLDGITHPLSPNEQGELSQVFLTLEQVQTGPKNTKTCLLLALKCEAFIQHNPLFYKLFIVNRIKTDLGLQKRISQHLFAKQLEKALINGDSEQTHSLLKGKIMILPQEECNYLTQVFFSTFIRGNEKNLMCLYQIVSCNNFRQLNPTCISEFLAKLKYLESLRFGLRG